MNYFESGLYKATIGDHKGAVAEFNKAIMLDPTDDRAYLAKGMSVAELKVNKETKSLNNHASRVDHESRTPNRL